MIISLFDFILLILFSSIFLRLESLSLQKSIDTCSQLLQRRLLIIFIYCLFSISNLMFILYVFYMYWCPYCLFVFFFCSISLFRFFWIIFSITLSFTFNYLYLFNIMMHQGETRSNATKYYLFNIFSIFVLISTRLWDAEASEREWSPLLVLPSYLFLIW